MKRALDQSKKKKRKEIDDDIYKLNYSNENLKNNIKLKQKTIHQIYVNFFCLSFDQIHLYCLYDSHRKESISLLISFLRFVFYFKHILMQ